MNSIQPLLEGLQKQDAKSLARCISLVENETGPWEELLQKIPVKNVPVIGITGPPGAGKSTLVNAIARQFLTQKKKVGLLLIDPSSPFNMGALLGDRIRMNELFVHQDVFIRSMASRGSLGGLSEKVIEATDLMRAFGFDIILVETVGVGQTEVEIAGLADVTVLVLVPESGDAIQTMKSGLLEVGDVLVVNKSDRPGAAEFANYLHQMVLERRAADNERFPIISCTATENQGVEKICLAIESQLFIQEDKLDRKAWLLAEKSLRLIRRRLSQAYPAEQLQSEIHRLLVNRSFQLYQYVHQKLSS